MRKLKINLSILCVVFIFGAARAQKMYTYESVDGDPLGIRVYTLENGLKAYLSVNKDEPRVQTAIAVKAGSKNDPAETTGLAHYLEHMLFKGTSKIATVNWEEEKKILVQISNLYEKHRATDNPDRKKEIYQEIDRLSTQAAKYAVPNELDKIVSAIGGKNTNAFTSNEQTVYINDIPSNEIEKWLLVESNRFQELVLRLFHTELEAVYEEYNRVLDNDFRKVYQKLNEELFKNHPYGTQTTIGKGEHLKNPSMVKIHEYFKTYYVPNNVAVCISGDIHPDELIVLIDKYFGSWESRDVPAFTFEPEAPITSPVKLKVSGPQAESVNIGFRLNGANSQDALVLELIDGMLNNGQAGLIDLNLLNQQKVLAAGSYINVMKDYSTFMMYGKPREGQTLEEVETLLLEQLANVGSGNYDPELIDAVKKNLELNYIKNNEGNWGRTMNMVDAFILDQPLKKVVTKSEQLKKITKAEIEQFAKTYLNNSGVTVYKLTGEDQSAIKVDKPEITPLDINRELESAFFKEFSQMPSQSVEPVFLDYDAAIKKDMINANIPFYYIENTTNPLFTMFYIWDLGSDNDEQLALAMSYLKYLGTNKKTSDELKTELFKLGLSLDFISGRDKIYIKLSGLESSMNAGIDIMEDLLNDVRCEAKAYHNMIGDIVKNRADNKLNKYAILNSAMANYAKYGKTSPFTSIISETDLKQINPGDLGEKIKSLRAFPHKVFYYGAIAPEKVKTLIASKHKVSQELKSIPEPKQFLELETSKNLVYFINYDMVQAELLMISKNKIYDNNELAQASIFNEYFGSGLSSIVFQEIRETKALAYSAYCRYTIPQKPGESHYVQAYIGTQADKLNQATEAMQTLMNNMPEAQNQFVGAKTSAMKLIETDRITKTSIYWSYEDALKFGRNYDIRKDIYPAIEKMTMEDLKTFFDKNIANRKYTYLVIGNAEKVDMSILDRLGEVKVLTLEEVFGY